MTTIKEIAEIGMIMRYLGNFENLDNHLRLAEFLRFSDTFVLAIRDVWRELQKGDR